MPECKYDKEKPKEKPKEKRQRKTEVAKAIKRVVVYPRKGRPRKYPEGTYWQHYSALNRDKLNARSRERYRENPELKREQVRKWREKHPGYHKEWYQRKKEERRVNRDERVRALLGNLKNWSWDVNPQFRVEKEDSDALRDYVKELENEKYSLNQRIRELEEKIFINQNG